MSHRYPPATEAELDALEAIGRRPPHITDPPLGGADGMGTITDQCLLRALRERSDVTFGSARPVTDDDCRLSTSRSPARRLTQDEDDALESPDREGTLRRLGVVTVRHRGEAVRAEKSTAPFRGECRAEQGSGSTSAAGLSRLPG